MASCRLALPVLWFNLLMTWHIWVVDGITGLPLGTAPGDMATGKGWNHSFRLLKWLWLCLMNLQGLILPISHPMMSHCFSRSPWLSCLLCVVGTARIHSKTGEILLVTLYFLAPHQETGQTFIINSSEVNSFPYKVPCKHEATHRNVNSHQTSPPLNHVLLQKALPSP